MTRQQLKKIVISFAITIAHEKGAKLSTYRFSEEDVMDLAERLATRIPLEDNQESFIEETCTLDVGPAAAGAEPGKVYARYHRRPDLGWDTKEQLKKYVELYEILAQEINVLKVTVPVAETEKGQFKLVFDRETREFQTFLGEEEVTVSQKVLIATAALMFHGKKEG